MNVIFTVVEMLKLDKVLMNLSSLYDSKQWSCCYIKQWSCCYRVIPPLMWWPGMGITLPTSITSALLSPSTPSQWTTW